MKIIVASPHKVGSTWLVGLLSGILGQKRVYQVPEAYREIPSIAGLINLHTPSVRDFLSGLTDTGVFKSHSTRPEWVTQQNTANDVYFYTIMRDPRDALVSLAFYLTTIPREHGGHPELMALPVKDRVAWVLENGNFDLPLYEAWAWADGVHKFHYEDLLAAPKNTLAAGFKRYGLPLEATDQVLAAHSFESKSGGRKRGTEDPTSFFRKGTTGDWKNHFDEALAEKFKTAHNGRWNKVLLQLGYEKDPDWQLAPAPDR